MNNLLFIFPETDALNDQPEVVIQETNDKNPEYFIFVILSLNPFCKNDPLFIRVWENQASFMFTITSTQGRSCAILTA